MISPPTGTSELGVRQVSKHFGATIALDSVSFDFAPGTVLGLAGHNGSGKSTLIKAMAGYHLPEPGAEVLVDGTLHEWHSSPPQWAARLRFLHQDLGLVPTMNAVENFALSTGYSRRTFGNIHWSDQRRRTAEAMERLGATINLSTPMTRLSTTDRTMLALARAFSGLPPNGLLVLDEPTAALTADEARPMFASLRRVVEHGAAVLLVTHHLEELLEHADKIAVLRDGRLVCETQAADLDRAELTSLVAGTPVGRDSRENGELPAAARNGPPALVIDHLAGGRLRELSLTVHAGEIVGVGGLSGSGRGDVASLLTGADRRADGSVRLHGREVPSGNPRRASALGIAFAPSDRRTRALFPNHSVGHNVTLPRLPAFRRGILVNTKHERSAAVQALESCQLVPAEPDKSILEFSGGNQQKAVVARCLQTAPTLLVLDEPTQGVDIGARSTIYALLRNAAKSGTAIVVCSSDDEELAELCDRVAVLVRGQVSVELSGRSLDATRLTHASLGETPLSESAV